jgi:hypothetical protein
VLPYHIFINLPRLSITEIFIHNQNNLPMKKFNLSLLLVILPCFLVFISSCKKDKTTTPPLAIGQAYQGGIIFYLDASLLHGMICASQDQTVGIAWQPDPVGSTSVRATAVGTGQQNTTNLVNQLGTGTYAAKLCDDLVLNGYSDWYLPSRDELILMYTNLATIGLGGFNTSMGVYYWSSSEIDEQDVWGQSFTQHDAWVLNKLYRCPVRAVRSF